MPLEVVSKSISATSGQKADGEEEGNCVKGVGATLTLGVPEGNEDGAELNEGSAVSGTVGAEDGSTPDGADVGATDNDGEEETSSSTNTLPVEFTTPPALNVTEIMLSLGPSVSLTSK